MIVVRRHLVLVGLMGSGKTTVGRLLAERLGRPLVDSDERIERLTGRTVRQIREQDGVAVMRRHEAAALFEALNDHRPSVIAAAAGVVLDASHRRRLGAAHATVVWLDGSPDMLAARAADGTHRPFLDDDAVGTLHAMYERRAAWYREVADLVLPIDGLTPGEIAERIVP